MSGRMKNTYEVRKGLEDLSISGGYIKMGHEAIELEGVMN
jgi:hypothetical protein